MRNRLSFLSRTVLPAAALGWIAAGCGDDPAEGTIVLHLTDAPFPFDMVASTDVEIDSVAVRVNGAADSEGGFHTVSRTPRSVNLLELRNGVTFALGSAVIPAGGVDQIRVYTGDATITLTDDRTFPLTFPSGSSAGVKVFVDPPIEVGDGEIVEALIDYDLSQSFSATPSSPTKVEDITAFSFHPVFRVTNLQDVGAVSGTITDDGGTPVDSVDDAPLAGAAVLILRGATEITSTATGADGRYVLLGVP
ncbi:MAG TPA: DUF4382 domain-containing protein, partial [bacterium]|nr:DUF4382 domain-containing protein [bacterium]